MNPPRTLSAALAAGQPFSPRPARRTPGIPPPRPLREIGRSVRSRPARAIAPLALFLLVLLPLAACLHPSIRERVNVGGHELQYRCSGKGAPVVVMDAGLGGTMATWNEVTPGIEAFTRVCSYDRAGLGRSGPGPMPRTSAQIVKELHALLVNAGIPPPYILVGHSLGGLNVRLYAGEYPGEVAGLVLVDATHEDYPARERELRPEQERKRIEASFASAGAAARSEYESLAASVAEVRAAPPLPDVPLTVITAGNHAESRVLNEVWMTLQGDLVRLAPRGRQVIAPESGHYVQFDQPAIIVSAVRDMVRELRPASPGPAAR